VDPATTLPFFMFGAPDLEAERQTAMLTKSWVK